MKIPLISLNEMLGFREELHVKLLLIHNGTENLKYFHSLIYRVKINRMDALILSAKSTTKFCPEFTDIFSRITAKTERH